MVRDTVAHLAEGEAGLPRRRALLRRLPREPRLRLEVLRTAAEVGAEAALCDTNGGMLPGWVADVVDDVIQTTGVRVGIHCHNDTGCAVANTLAAVDAGATHVQGTLNGYGERMGNADLVSVVANLELKLGRQVLPPGHLREATRIAHAVAEVTNFPPASRQPYVGSAPSRTRPGCTRARSRSTRTCTSTWTRCSWATTCAFWSRTWPGASIELKDASSAST